MPTPTTTLPKRSGFFGFTVGRPVALLVIFITLVVVSLIAYSKIPLQLLPGGFSNDQVMVWIPNPDASPRENEEKVARVVEAELRTLQGLKRVRSWSSESRVRLSVEFQPSVDMELAKAEVRDRLERAQPSLPDTTEQIGMWSESGGTLPLSYFSIGIGGDSADKDYLIDEVIIPRMEAADGVSKVQVWGVMQDTVRIELDEDRVAASNMDVSALIRKLSRDNFALPLGEVSNAGSRLILRSDMRFGELSDIENYPIGNGMVLSDVGRVQRSKSVRDQISRVDGKFSYFGIAQKESQANVVTASNNFRDAMDKLMTELDQDPELGGQVNFVPFFVQGDMIQSSLDQLKRTALGGGVFAALILFLFLRRFRTTLCVALAIPFSSLLALAFEYFTGGSFNMLTMIGITLGIGMLVDNAVVVVENIVRLKAESKDDLEAAARGTAEIALPVTLATLTTVVVFMPIIFMSGNPMLRLMFGGVGIPLCMSMLASLLVAVVFMPVAIGRVVGERGPLASKINRILDKALELPARLLAYAIGAVRFGFHKLISIGFHLQKLVLRLPGFLFRLAGIALVAAAVPVGLGNVNATRLMLENKGLGKTLQDHQVIMAALMPVLVPALICGLLLFFALPAWKKSLIEKQAPQAPDNFVPHGHSLIDWLIASNRRLVAWTLDHRLAAIGLSCLALFTIVIPINSVVTAAFSQGGGENSIEFGVTFDADFTLAEAFEEMKMYEQFLDEHKEEYGFNHVQNRFDSRSAEVSMYFEGALLPETQTRVLNHMRENLPKPPGHEVHYYNGENVSENSSTVTQFTLRGTDSVELAALGAQAHQILQNVPGLSGITLPDASAPEQMNVEIDRDIAHSFGIGAGAAIESIGWALRGVPLPRFQERGREIPLILELDRENAPNLATLRDLPVYTVSNQVPLSSFADFSVSKGASTIYREDGQISYTLTAQVDDPSRLSEISATGYSALRQIEMPRGFSLATDQSIQRRADDEIKELGMAGLLSLVLIFLVMAILFESLILPFSVLTTIPFAVVGAVWSIWALGNPIDAMGMIGIIILAGLVVNNGIVLIDRIHRLASTMDRKDAVLAGCAHRVRPIVMTALTTVVGLIPMSMVPPASGSIDYRSMATIMIGGLLASTFFTLWVVPLAYTLLDDLRLNFIAAFRWAKSPTSGDSKASTSIGSKATATVDS
ncbi:MAG: HAE1 family hydrophobic/amphiphilic exporter-1 [Planctomycetota bacterium]|jgi:HAE1 family hydrophobic/amphiphilic exporter-1